MSVDQGSERADLIAQLLTAALVPDQINVLDQSHLHAGHPNPTNGGHFTVFISSPRFVNKTPLERHKMIYAALGEIMGREIHALSIEAKTPLEVMQKHQ